MNYDKDQVNRMTQKLGRTITIGSIAAIEEHFGYLWGFGKDDDERNEDELYWLDKWLELRKQILDYGHDQMNYAEIKDKKYNYTFYFKGNENGKDRR